MFYRWGVGNSESYITPIELDLGDELISNWDYAGNNMEFYVGEKKNIWLGGSELNDGDFTLQSVTHWVNDTHGVTYVSETDADVTTSGFRIYSLIDSTGWSTASDPYTLFIKWHLNETPLETFITEVMMDAEKLE